MENGPAKRSDPCLKLAVNRPEGCWRRARERQREIAPARTSVGVLPDQSIFPPQASMIIVHHLENSRSQRILWLLEELQVQYEVSLRSLCPTAVVFSQCLYDGGLGFPVKLRLTAGLPGWEG